MNGRHGRSGWNDGGGRAIFAAPDDSRAGRWLAPRRAFGLAALACFCLIGFALYLQYVQKEDPCPLCILQRVALIGMGLVFMVAALHAPRRTGLRIYSALAALIGAAGAAVAGRHVWLQNLPKDFIDIHFAFSRTPGQPRRYVQDLMRERAADLALLLKDANTHFYVCGLKSMEEGVVLALQDVAQQAGLSWDSVGAALKAQGRLHLETY